MFNECIKICCKSLIFFEFFQIWHESLRMYVSFDSPALASIPRPLRPRPRPLPVRVGRAEKHRSDEVLLKEVSPPHPSMEVTQQCLESRI